MKFLAVDYGTKRLGLAVSSPDENHVFPYATLQKTTRVLLFSQLLDIIEKESIESIVIGLPLYLNGEESLSTAQAKNFAQSVKRRVDMPVYLVDERLSSYDAEEEFRTLAMKQKNVKKILDQAAAMRILSSFFNLPTSRRVPI